MKELHELLDDVNDKTSFLSFAKALVEDRKPHEGKSVDEVGFVADWANNNIWEFLEGAVAWAEDSDFGKRQDSNLEDNPGNPWKQFAEFLYCGKIYE